MPTLTAPKLILDFIDLEAANAAKQSTNALEAHFILKSYKKGALEMWVRGKDVENMHCVLIEDQQKMIDKQKLEIESKKVRIGCLESEIQNLRTRLHELQEWHDSHL